MQPLADRLRTTVTLAKVEPRVREHLGKLVDDPHAFGPIVRELGLEHGVVREVLRVTGRTVTPSMWLEEHAQGAPARPRRAPATPRAPRPGTEAPIQRQAS